MFVTARAKVAILVPAVFCAYLSITATAYVPEDLSRANANDTTPDAATRLGLTVLKTCCTNFDLVATRNSWKGWVTTSQTPICEWTGIVCDSDQVLHSVSLPNAGLQGSLPWGLGKFLNVAHLNLSGNPGISGSLPETWGVAGWDHLITLDLSGNSISGKVPASWGRTAMGNLAELRLGGNRLSGSLPQAWAFTDIFPHLTTLDLSHNSNLTSHLPSHWGKAEPGVAMGMSQLHSLNLSGCSLNGSLKAVWANDLPLQHVDLSWNQLTGTLPDTTWQGLKTLSLEGNFLSGKVPELWGQEGAWPDLEMLSLADNRLTGELPATFGAGGSMTHLNQLSLSGNRLSGSISPSWQGRFPELEKLVLFANGAGNDWMSEIEHVALYFLAGLLKLSATESSFLQSLDANDLLPASVHVKVDAAFAHGQSAGRHDSASSNYAALLARECDWLVPPSSVHLCSYPDGRPVKLGSGSFGTVYKAVQNDGGEVAVKIFRVDGEATGQQLAAVRQEIDIIRGCRHQNVVQFLGACLDQDNLMLVTELLSCDLHTALGDPSRRPRLRWYQGGRTVILHMARGLHYLHSKGIIHFDVKSSNVLLTADLGTAKLADVGLAKLLTSATHVSNTSMRGTWDWAAPEIITAERCTTAVDIFGLGVCIWEICTGERPCRGQNRDVRVPEEAPEEVLRLMAWCNHWDPKERPTAWQVVQYIMDMPQ
ncbi:hypothetical protein WJX73_009659 [Symbiochloris irregularis]|uniref:Protein kinase domain-containing protein n=1 Tax=Symbiochloris irregularis TaxID=706552 RepID=A0AAW1PFK6_9CHLO